jgi:hypothetical protein
MTRKADGSCSGYTVNLRTDNVSAKVLEETSAELDAISENVFWQVNHEMYRTLSWQGITRTVFDAPRPWADIHPEETTKSDIRLKSQGYTRRPLTIGIMGEFVVALRQFPPGSEAHLRAVFMAAITMTREVGHAVFQQDFRSLDYDPTQGYEPWVGRDCWADLGLSYVGWIFGGYNPIPCAMGSIDHPLDFQAPLSWFKQFTIDEQPLYETVYSIGVPYLEEVLSNTLWDSLAGPETSAFSEEAKKKLQPAIEFVEPQPATAIIPQWEWTWLEGALWKTKFNDRRVGGRPVVTPDEIQWEQTQLRIRHPHTRPTLWTGDPNPRMNLSDVRGEDEDGEIRFGPLAKLYTEPNLDYLRQADLPLREMDDGFISPDMPECKGGSANVFLTVRYRPDRVLTGPPRGRPKRHMNGPDDPEKGEEFKEQDKDPSDLIAAYCNKVDHKISRMTHEQAFKYCQARDIGFGLDYEDDEIWQKSRLDRSDYKERGLIQRIKQYSFRQLQERFKDSPCEVLRIKEFASRVSDWVDEDLVDFCKTHCLSTSGDIQDRMHQVRTWMNMDFEEGRAVLSARDAGRFARMIGDYQSLKEDDMTKWTGADFMAFFSNNKLPTWGIRNTWEQRVLRFQEEKAEDGGVSRWAINQDALGVVLRTRGGVEIYRFEANPHRTSVAILKTELLARGMFQSDSILYLYFGSDRQNALEDDKPLSFYHGKSFNDMWLEVRTPDYDVEDDTVGIAERPIVYQALRLARRNNHGKSNHQVPAPDLSLKRTYDIMEGTVPRIVTERMQQVRQLASRLTQAIEAGGRREILHPHLQGRQSTSEAEKLDDPEKI